METEHTDADFEVEVTEQQILKTDGFKSVRLQYRTYWHYKHNPNVATVDFHLQAVNEFAEPTFSMKIKVTYSIAGNGKLSFERAIPLFRDALMRSIDYSNGITKKLYGPIITLEIPREEAILVEFEKNRSTLS